MRMVAMTRGRWLGALTIAALLMLGGCGELQPPGQHHYIVYHTVRPGDTLYSIAWRYGYDYHEVAAWNHVKAPYRIYVGQRLVLIPPATPEVGDGSAATTIASSPAPVVDSGNKSTAAHSIIATKNRSPVSVEKPVWRPHHLKITWRWPTRGVVKRSFMDPGSKKGIDIGGSLGQPVYAAAAGDVVYSGNGLVGYGNLVIIKHDDTFLSAYGNNRRLLVKEGEHVKAGQMIAEMGQTGKDGAVLHFEIRQEGKPVDPLRYLPRKTN